MDLSNHIVTNIAYTDPKWLSFRLNGIGGSEVSTLFPEVCGGEYSSPLEMYYQKIGWIDVPKFDNPAMAFGRWLEELIADRWQYFDNTTDEFGQPNYIRNYTEGKIVRKCRRLNGYIQSNDFPWLFASVDRLINKNQINLATGEVMDKEGILECKTISGFVTDKWISGVPPSYIFQVHQYMLILGLDFAEYSILKDGRYLDVIGVKRSDVICNQIVEVSKAFWYNHVVPGKKAVQEYKTAQRFGNTAKMNEAEALIAKLEPMPTQGDAYRRFLSEKFKAERTETPGNEFQLSLCKQYEVLTYIKKHFEGECSLIYNSILSEFDRNKTNKLDWGAEGYARYNKKLTNKVKADFDKEALNKDLNALNIEY
jgi:predicted phage-related endonuclease